MPPCRKICTGRWKPTPLPTSEPAEGGTCPAAVGACPAAVSACPAAVSACPAAVSACPAAVSACPAAVRACPATVSACSVTVGTCSVAVSTCPVAVSACPVVVSACPVAVGACPAAVSACPAAGGTCPAPAQVPDCGCDEELVLTCDEDTCANAADCKQLHPDVCPHGLAADDDRTESQPPAKPELTHLICPHCQSHIAMYDDLKQPPPVSHQSQTGNTWPAQKQSFNAAGQFPNPNRPFTDGIKYQSTTSPAPSCGNSALKLKSPHTSSHAPEPADGAIGCCMSGSATHRVPNMGRTPEGPESYSDMDGDEQSESPAPKGLKAGAVMGETSAAAAQCKLCMQAAAQCKLCMQAAAQCKLCMPAAATRQPVKCCSTSAEGQADYSSPRGASQFTQMGQAAAQPTRDTSGKGKDEQNPPGSQSQCPRSGAQQLFPARPAPQPCLCRMPPAYHTGCTGNLSGNCNCTTCNK